MRFVIEKEFLLIEQHYHIYHDRPVRGMSEVQLVSSTRHGPYQRKSGAIRKLEAKIKEYQRNGYKISKKTPRNGPVLDLYHDFKSRKPRLQEEVDDIQFLITERQISEKPIR